MWPVCLLGYQISLHQLNQNQIIYKRLINPQLVKTLLFSMFSRLYRIVISKKKFFDILEQKYLSNVLKPGLMNEVDKTLRP